MAAADYRLCDVCDGKAFYDANLNYEHGRDNEWAKSKTPFRWAGEEQGKPESDDWLLRLDYLGDRAVICSDCAKTHKTIVVPLYAAPVVPQAEPCIGNDPACPCQDGDACHYRDTATTKAWPIPQREHMEAVPLREPNCGCRTCLTPAEIRSTFVVCPKCGNKRCPRADDHRNVCTGSNEVGQTPQREPHIEVSLAAGHGYCGVAIYIGAQNFPLAASFESFTEADAYAERLRKALGTTGGSEDA